VPRHGSSHVDSAQKLGRRIVRARGSLSQRQLAKSVGVSAAYISRIERGERVPTLQLLERIAGVLGVDLSWLRGKESASAPATSHISVAAIEVELDAIEAALARIRSSLRAARS
jgi:transcriptional regulator with XRE-family HTH domain